MSTIVQGWIFHRESLILDILSWDLHWHSDIFINSCQANSQNISISSLCVLSNCSGSCLSCHTCLPIIGSKYEVFPTLAAQILPVGVLLPLHPHQDLGQVFACLCRLHSSLFGKVVYVCILFIRCQCLFRLAHSCTFFFSCSFEKGPFVLPFFLPVMWFSVYC